MKCSTLDCNGRAAWRPKIQLKIPGHTPIPYHYPVVQCDKCRDAAALDTYLDDDLWTTMVDEFTKRGLAEPEKHLTVLEWSSL